MRREVFSGLLLLGVIGVVLPATPASRPIPGIDSGVFNYVAWRMTEGEIPYRDVWDHKPPIIYFTSYLGLMASRGSVWGNCIIFGLMLAAGVLTGFNTLRKPFGDLAAFAALWLALISALRVTPAAIMTEEYVLVWGFMILALYRDSLVIRVSWWRSALMGALSAILLFTKQTNIGVPAAVCLGLLLFLTRQRQWLDLMKGVAFFLLGFLAIGVLVVSYFWFHDALAAFWEGAFAYNLRYREAPAGDELYAAWQGRQYFARSGLLYPAVLGIPLGLSILRRAESRKAYGDPLIVAALIGWPIEIWLSGISGRAYNHYFFIWIPAMTLLASLSFSQFIQGFPDSRGNPRLHVREPLRRTTVLALLGAFSLANAPFLSYLLFDARNSYAQRNQIVGSQFISENTDAKDPILMWGAESGVLFDSRRRSATRFVYQWPLFEGFLSTPDAVELFRQDLERRPPRLIIDTSEVNPRNPPLDPGRYEKWLDDTEREPLEESLRDIADELYRSYEYVGRLMHWHVYVKPGFHVTLPIMSRHDERRIRYHEPVTPFRQMPLPEERSDTVHYPIEPAPGSMDVERMN